MKSWFIVLAFLIVGAAPFLLSRSDLSRTGTVDELIDELDAKTDRLLHRYAVPGAAISIIENGEVRWKGTFGYADLEQREAVSEQTVFQVASISKSVAALGAMQLVEDGQIDLFSPAESYLSRWQLPESEFDTDEVTIQRLLSHTAGLTLGGYPGYEPDKPLPTLEQSLSGTGVTTPPVALFQQPGTTFSYSGGGYTLLELIIEEVTGLSFTNYMDSQVLAALEMDNSSFEWQPRLRPDTAKAYDENLNPLPNYLFTEKAAAGLYSTIGDLSNFVIAEYDSYHGNARGMLSQQTMTTLYEPIADVVGLSAFVYQHTGLGHFINFTPDGTRLVIHDGGNEGWHTNFTLVPETGNGIVILTNGNNGTYLISDVLDAWHMTLFQIPRFPLLNQISSGVYSLAWLLFLWSGLAAFNLVSELRQRIRGFVLTKTKVQVALRMALVVLLILLVVAIAQNVIPLLSFLSPTIGSVLLSAVALRVFLGILQILFPRMSREGIRP
jgi:CubicO group peptidase (beta-lactamase class C family)